jgi:hypothetical protein
MKSTKLSGESIGMHAVSRYNETLLFGLSIVSASSRPDRTRCCGSHPLQIKMDRYGCDSRSGGGSGAAFKLDVKEGTWG